MSEDPKADQRAAEKERLNYAINDMRDVAAAAQFLTAVKIEDEKRIPFDVRLVIETGMFTTYGRAFTESRGADGQRGLPTAPTKGLSTAERELHEWALERRMQVAAHTERFTDARRVTQVSWDSKSVTVDHFRPAEHEQVLALGVLAERLVQMYVVRLSDLEAGTA